MGKMFGINSSGISAILLLCRISASVKFIILCWTINEVIIFFYVELILRSQKSEDSSQKTVVRRLKSGGKKWSGWIMGFLTANGAGTPYRSSK